MKRMTKRGLSLIMCVVLIIGTMGSTALAAKKNPEEIYAPVLDMLYYNIKSNWKHYKEPEYYDGTKINVNYVSSIFRSYLATKLANVEYWFKDINKDGTPELFVLGRGDGIFENLYTYNDGKITLLATSFERSYYSILKDNTIKYYYSGAMSGMTERYKLKKGKTDISIVEAVYYEADDDYYSGYGDIHAYHAKKEYRDKDGRILYSALKEISIEKFDSIVSSWPKEVNLHGKSFKKYKPKGGVVYKVTTSKLSETKLSKVASNKNTAIVTWKKNTKGKGYQLQYSTKKNFSSGVNTVKISKNKTVKTTVKKLKAKTTYYFRIRTVKGGNVSAWSGTKSVKTK